LPLLPWRMKFLSCSSRGAILSFAAGVVYGWQKSQSDESGESGCVAKRMGVDGSTCLKTGVKKKGQSWDGDNGGNGAEHFSVSVSSAVATKERRWMEPTSLRSQLLPRHRSWIRMSQVDRKAQSRRANDKNRIGWE
jgi:hypothetical protein